MQPISIAEIDLAKRFAELLATNGLIQQGSKSTLVKRLINA